MTCHNCNTQCKKFGKHRNGLQRFRCKTCKKTFTEERADPLDGMYTSIDRAEKVLQLLLEGCSISSTERITGVHHTTILTMLSIVGAKCERLMNERVQNVPVQDVQCDEIWGFVGKKEAHKWSDELRRQDIGDAYCFVGLERTTKLILAWHLGKRTTGHTDVFIRKLANATAQKPYQLSTDGFSGYIAPIDQHLSAVGWTMGSLLRATEHRGKVSSGIPPQRL